MSSTRFIQKKAKRGIATPRRDVEITRSRRKPERITVVSGPYDGTVIESSGNVFADLEVADPEEALIKAELARAITAIVTGRHLTQTQAAEALGIDQPKVSALMRGRLSGFSVDRLLRFLLALDRDVEIVIAPKRQQQPHTRVSVVSGS